MLMLLLLRMVWLMVLVALPTLSGTRLALRVGASPRLLFHMVLLPLVMVVILLLLG